MTAPNRPTADQNAAAKGIALLVVAVIIGVVLLARFGGGGGGGGHDRTSGTDAPTTTEAGGSTTTEVIATGTTSKPVASLKIAVFNGMASRVDKAAGNTKKALVGAHYADANITVGHDLPAERSKSVVFYGPTAQRGDAAAVAKVMGFTNTAVQAEGTAELPTGSAGADVVVIVGADAQNNAAVTGASSGSSSTSSSTATTAG